MNKFIKCREAWQKRKEQLDMGYTDFIISRRAKLHQMAREVDMKTDGRRRAGDVDTRICRDKLKAAADELKENGLSYNTQAIRANMTAYSFLRLLRDKSVKIRERTADTLLLYYGDSILKGCDS